MNIVLRRLQAIILALTPHDGSAGKPHRKEFFPCRVLKP